MDKQELIDRLRAKAKENGQKTAQYSDYTDKTYFTGIQRGYDRSAKLVDQLNEPEHEKVILPQAVGEEIDNYKSHDKRFNDYIEDVFSGQDYMYAITYLANDNKLEALADAWRYGWKAEKEPVSLVYVPGTNKDFVYCKRGKWSKQGANPETPVTPQPIATWRACEDKDERLFEFTDAEITKFGLQDCEREEITDDDK